MSIVGPDGTPTESGSKLMLAIKAGFSSPDAIAKMSGLPSFIVINGLRDLEKARLIKRYAGGYELDERGKDIFK